MVRKKAASITHKNTVAHWRSHEPSRLETFSDAVFAFALTLIIVSIEVPKSFDELYETMKGTLSFAICFAVLFYIWNSQNIFFRKYGLKDSLTTVLNGCLLFVVLVYAYPLKFLSVLLFGTKTYMLNGQLHPIIGEGQVCTLMLIYGAGYAVIYLLFCLMYFNAARHAEVLELSKKELFDVRTSAYINLISACIGIVAAITALMLPVSYSGLSGFVYFLIPLSYSTWYSYRGKKSRKLFPAGA